MNFRTFTIIAVLILIGTLPQWATSFTPPHPVVRYSDDKQFKLEVEPPKFTNELSYHFFQNEDFVALNAAEGREASAQAAVKVTLSRLDKASNYFTMWSRPSPCARIPLQAHVLSYHEEPIVILEGKYFIIDAPEVPFTVFGQSGHCITNSTYISQRQVDTNYLKNLKWSYDGNLLRLEGKGGKPISTIKVK